MKTFKQLRENIDSITNSPSYNKHNGKLVWVGVTRDKQTGKLISTTSQYEHPKGGYPVHKSNIEDSKLNDHISHIKNAVSSGIHVNYTRPDGRTSEITSNNVEDKIKDIQNAHKGIVPKEYSDYHEEQAAKRKAEKERYDNMSQSDKNELERKAAYGGNTNNPRGLGS